MFKANLLHSDEEYIYKKQKAIEENVFEDLKIARIFDFCAPLNFDHIKKEDVKYTQKTLQNPCTLKKDILFRQGIFKVFLASDTLADNLYKALEDINILDKIKENYDFDYGSEKDIEYLKAVNYIFFLKNYELYLENIYSVMAQSGADFENSGLNDFFSRLGLEKEKMDSPEIVGPMDELLSYFAGKKIYRGSSAHKTAFSRCSISIRT
jgi:hypothetical protein